VKTTHGRNQSRSVRSLEVALGVCGSLLLGGCWGGPSAGPQLDSDGNGKSAVLLTAKTSDDGDDVRDRKASAGAGAESDVTDAGMGTGMGDEAPPDGDDSLGPDTRPVIDPNVPSGDDSVRCGDGVLDANELCDIGIKDGKRGACVTDCGSDPCAKLQVHGCMTQCVTDTDNPECAPDGE
jgi:hypothetical protein